MEELRTSAGGIVYRIQQQKVQVVLISVGHSHRWQLPKGRVDPGEAIEDTALREVREETGISAEILASINKIDYWFYEGPRYPRKRVHKYVHFFLMRYLTGQTEDHDQEVNEARWVPAERALAMLTFESERRMLNDALALITN